MVIALGLDLIDIPRVERLFARDAERAARRLLTEGEWRYCQGMANRAVHVAVRLAAKEAGFKALAGTPDARGIGWREIEVVHDDHRRPLLALHGRAETRARELGVTRALVSLSHSRQTAGAVVVFERDA